jgi:protein kinase-like protein
VSRHPDADATIGRSTDATRAAPSSGGDAPRTPLPTRFAPGSIIAGRYRLIALLGRGGMGEVYRAEDLTLDQPVALKFLPEHVAADPLHLAQFHNELRVARQVSHKNVCRLYDLGDADGRRFLTMEYVDGEDLASLLRRIGRIPHDKAIELARQLCAGLAAAHDRGVLHRDLKPANVMIDGDGNVRLTDFGLAMAATDVDAVRAGTPQYMAPEQLIGGSGPLATVKTDIYALGLVLFEIFTGRRAYDAKTLPDLIKVHESGSIATPSSMVRDLDPAVERTIMRCLERDPLRRPASALAVAAALPGGDPLAAALAAGETPSPELLVAAGQANTLAVVPGLAAVAVFIAVLIAFAAIAPRASIAGLVPLEKPPDVLADRAVQMLASFGYREPRTDNARGFTIAPDPPRWAQRVGGADWWPSLRSGTLPALLFWYRTSPRDLLPITMASSVSSTDPPALVSGMDVTILDTLGRLREFHRVPPQLDADAADGSVPDWRPLFDAAGLDLNAFTDSAPQWAPPHFADTRAAWEGPLSDRSEIKVRVEAAAYRGRPTSFYVVGPWSRPTRMTPIARTTAQRVASAGNMAMSIVLLIGAALLARFNLRVNRADRSGAARLAVAVVLIELVSWVFSAHHVATAESEFRSFSMAITLASALGVSVWLTYIAIEPYARRFWPDGLLGWSRLLSGHVRDPRVGRDILIGMAFGAGLMALETAHALLPQQWGHQAPLPPFGNSVASLAAPSMVVSRWVATVYGALQGALLIAFIFVVLRLVLRRGWLAAIGGTIAMMALVENGVALTGTWFDTALYTAIAGIITLAVYRFGLLVMAVMYFTDNMATTVPLTLHASAWWATSSNLTIALLIGLACFGYDAARAGQPLLGKIESMVSPQP